MSDATKNILKGVEFFEKPVSLVEADIGDIIELDKERKVYLGIKEEDGRFLPFAVCQDNLSENMIQLIVESRAIREGNLIELEEIEVRQIAQTYSNQ